jgi:diadenosine tetraphosphate (Ap4A) HIT family hydrolase
MLDDDCPFCVILDDGRSPCWNLLFNDRPSGEIVQSGERASAILDTAPITRGHLLIVPHEHVASLGKAKVQTQAEMMALKERSIEILTALYQPPTVLEHGAASFARNAGACVDHAHVHLVPGWFRLLDRLKQDYPDAQTFNNYEDALASFSGSPYIYCEEPSGKAYGAVAGRCQSQYLRRLASEAAGVGERWNWRDCIRMASAYGIAEDVRDASSQIQEFLASETL